MGCRRDRGVDLRKRRLIGAVDDSGQLSIDFLAGISIFVITLIIAATMISGLLVGLQSKKIDFDAVAYRTGVILAEDPGEPNTQFNYLTITEADQWEFIGYDQKDQVRRFGLTLYKSTPRILAEQKTARFFDRTQFPELSEYHDRMIAGDYPYHFNVSFRIIGEDTLYVGEPFDPHSSYGYIRRVVLVKNQTNAVVDMYQFNRTPDTDHFSVNLTYGWLLDQSRGPQYWIEPPKEDIVVNLTNFTGIKKDAGTPIKLKNIKMTFDGRLLDGTEVSGVDLPYREFLVWIDNTPPKTFNWPIGSGSSEVVNNAINITFPAGYFIPPSAYADITLIRMNIRYEFEPNALNLSSAYNSYEYLPDRPISSPGFSPPNLRPAIMEVRVW